ncbi:hypothetical protein [Persicirhabdus sediminis]|uniref:Uncharacterized protein n=1 Tax=Persicirhabdus sediminis TaxID=454144 RepID=A0A8J7MFJ4_9BACT|nr:hypothetical protein [Persicirhabdus sediminis]MBK1791783.1 hypothetical protein [Persicirhabdus sediminis]
MKIGIAFFIIFCASFVSKASELRYEPMTKSQIEAVGEGVDDPVLKCLAYVDEAQKLRNKISLDLPDVYTNLPFPSPFVKYSRPLRALEGLKGEARRSLLDQLEKEHQVAVRKNREAAAMREVQQLMNLDVSLLLDNARSIAHGQLQGDSKKLIISIIENIEHLEIKRRREIDEVRSNNGRMIDATSQ